jgi:hypothetical protein
MHFYPTLEGQQHTAAAPLYQQTDQQGSKRDMSIGGHPKKSGENMSWQNNN